MLVTIAPKTPLLSTLHAIGLLFPRSDRAPAIVPVSAPRLGREMTRLTPMEGHVIAETHRVSRAFYISEALRITRQGAIA
jgi:magnesium-protoporphyrin O-methyltransferase